MYSVDRSPGARPSSILGPEDECPDICLKHPTAAILLVSVLGLFVELLLIRWIGTEVRIFAYLQNTVLVVCFLGLGMGCFTCRQPINLRQFLMPLLLLLLLVAIPYTRRTLVELSQMLSVLSDFVIWFERDSKSTYETLKNVIPGLILAYILMYLIWNVFVPIGRMLGRLMDDHPHIIKAYSWNVGGSLLGIWLFVLLSVFFLPPWAWFVLLGLMVLPFVVTSSSMRPANFALLSAVVVTSWFASHQYRAMETHWSPYQKLVLFETPDRVAGFGDYLISVNNCGYQAMIDGSDAAVDADPERYPPDQKGYSHYDLPMKLHPGARHMLIVGAGSGNDVAGALRSDVEHVTAVEIDPAIISLGRRYHPEAPYSSPRVTMVTDDARSFFANCGQKFDVISFGLLDSHTTTAMTNARLDHYVYTRESIEQAKTLLNEGGIITLTFEAQRPFIADRMGAVLRQVFGQSPMYFRVPGNNYGWGGAMFVTGDIGTAHQAIAKDERLAGHISQWQAENPMNLTFTTPAATDDWPYIYLDAPRIPVLFFLLAALMLLLLVHGKIRLKISRLTGAWSMSHWHFFFLGAAFLLLEVQNISKAAVLLGNTWWVNAVIISGILCMILLANLVAARFPKMPMEPVYAGLCTSCLALYYVDLSSFASLPYATKVLVLGGLTAMPMLFSGIIFIRSFSRVQNKHEALGANMIGAIVGGLLQSITFLTGLKALLLIVTLFYLIAMLTRGDRAAGQEKETVQQSESGPGRSPQLEV